MRSCNDIIFLSDSSIESTGRDKHFIKLPGAARRQIQISPARLSGFWVFILSIASFSQDRSTNYFPQKNECKRTQLLGFDILVRNWKP